MHGDAFPPRGPLTARSRPTDGSLAAAVAGREPGSVPRTWPSNGRAHGPNHSSVVVMAVTQRQ